MAGVISDFWTWLRGAPGSDGSRALSSTEKRATLSSPAPWMLLGDDTQTTVNASTSIKISTVFSCIRVLTETLGALPKGHFLKTGEYRYAQSGKIQELIGVSPDGQITAFDFWHAVLSDLFRKGNGYALVVRDRMGRPVELRHLLHEDVTVKKATDGRAVWYQHKDAPDGAYAAEDVIHLKWFTLDGLVGVSPITYHRVPFNAALQQAQFSKDSLGAHGTGYIQYPEWVDLTDEEKRKDIAKNYKAMVGMGGGVPVLMGGAEYKRVRLAPGDAEYIQTRKLTREDICGIYRVPLFHIQVTEGLNYASSENADLSFVKHTLTPLAVMIEKQLALKLLSSRQREQGHYFKLNMNALLRGDTKTRLEYMRGAISHGVMSPNEWRAMEDMNPYDGGDVKLIQKQYADVTKLDTYHQMGRTSETQNETSDDNDSE